ncbi:MAG: permease-like cell division protein FtsX [Bacteroidota bacterium]|nr:permease-like cell division protein FtsX [Bacteroidota bacterium]MDX5429720.1 permease-like cell division protein FtsX [Bacteroidota bacterium]MDX5468501.1 permease-like cell division protein FtsX [Bacteroidota bacterium]
MAIFASDSQTILVKNTRRRHSSSLASILSIASVLVMLSLFMGVLLFGRKMEDRLREHISLTVLFHLDTDEAEVLKLKSTLEGREEIKEVKYYSREEGLQDMTEALNQDILGTLSFNPIPAALEIHFKADYANQVNMAKLKGELGTQKAVREITYQSGILEQIEANAKKVLLGVGALGLLFLIIAITLINGTIRLELYAQRFIIRSMQLVGATPWFIIRQFLGKGIKMALWALLIAVPIIAGLAYVVWVFIPEIEAMTRLEELGILLGIILVFDILLTTICSYLATRKYLRLKLEELY